MPNEDQIVDPDPFSIGLALMGVVFAGATFLEGRRRYALVQQQDRNRFRVRWYQAKHTLLRAREVIGAIEAFTSQYNYGGMEFAYGVVRLPLTRRDAKRLRTMLRTTNTIANSMVAHIDDLSDYIGPEHQETINKMMDKVTENQRPHSYDAVIIVARDAIDLFDELLTALEEEWL